MRRLYLRWLGLLVFVVVLSIAFVNLGQWQLRRLHDRREANAVILANEHRDPIPFARIEGKPVGEADEWQRVEVSGEFDAEQQFQVRYRSNNDVPGIEVVTPLRTDDGRYVLVDRGFFARGRGEPIPDRPPAPPSGRVTLIGHLRASENGRDNAITPVDGQVRLINVPALAATLPYEVNDGYLGVVEIDAPQAGDPVPVALPELSDGPHFWYAVQWFMFTAIAAAGLIVFIRGDLRERRRAKQHAPTDPTHGRTR